MPIGRIQTRWLDDGRVELGSMDAGGRIVTPKYATCPQVDIRTIDVQHIGTIYQ